MTGTREHCRLHQTEINGGTESIYLDTNVTFQQFDEFNDAFDVKEGDGMYLAPDERLVLW